MTKFCMDTSPQPLRISSYDDCTLVDRIHEIEAAYSKLQDLDSQKDNFLAALSHELKTPLTTILGWANLVQDQENPSRTAFALKTIERNAMRLLRMIEDLLAYSDCIGGHLILNPTTVNLRRSCEDVVARVSATFDDPASSEITIAPHLTIMADPTYLRQILEHLLTNAFKFTPSEGKVCIHAIEHEQWFALEISDTGIGIAPDDLESIYKIFWQADMSTTRRYNGAGIGLALVKELVALHGGGISVTSAGVNRGTRFSICFPRVIRPQAQ